MNKKLPFEEAFKRKMKEVQLPDENESWQKMKQLLDENKERKPFAIFRNEKIISSVMLLFLICLWLLIAPEKTNKRTNITDTKPSKASKQNMPTNKIQTTTANNSFTEQKTGKQKNSKDTFSSFAKIPVNAKDTLFPSYALINKNKFNAALHKQYNIKNNSSFISSSNKNMTAKLDDLKNNIPDSNIAVLQNRFNNYHTINTIIDSAKIPAATGKDNRPLATIINIDSNKTAIVKDSLQRITNPDATAIKTVVTIKKHSGYFVEAGIALKQQVPLNGQKMIAYNYNGTKTVLSDYIPSVYVQLLKDKQWFIQGEFNYASPRLVKEFTYLQKTKTDYVHSSTIVTANRLQKIFYNEVPVSFNLYIHPYLSVGAGVIYSRLRGAVASKEITINDARSGQQTNTIQVLPIKGFTDSFLYKTQTSLLLQANYDKEKWSFGLRFVQDIQPYITYTSPDGKKNDKKNSFFMLLIHYRLFKSSKFDKKNKNNWLCENKKIQE